MEFVFVFNWNGIVMVSLQFHGKEKRKKGFGPPESRGLVYHIWNAIYMSMPFPSEIQP
jgi:hypothetical protein